MAQLPELLAPLPLTLVDLDDALRTTLGNAGITTFGQAAALPRDALARRGGDELIRVIDRALGRVADPRPSFVPPPRFASKLDLPAPVRDAEALGFGVNRLVQELAAWLTARGLGVTRLQLTLAHERYLRQRGLPATVVPFALGAPARMPAHLIGVLRERLARVTLPAAVESITLACEGDGAAGRPQSGTAAGRRGRGRRGAAGRPPARAAGRGCRGAGRDARRAPPGTGDARCRGIGGRRRQARREARKATARPAKTSDA